MKENFEESFVSVIQMLRAKVADRLDVGLRHIRIIHIEPIASDDCYCYDNDPECGLHGERFETYRYFEYQYRKDLMATEYEEPVVMVWQHTEEEQGYNMHDEIMTEEEFDDLVAERGQDECSMGFTIRTN